jgi:hypothetical protein
LQAVADRLILEVLRLTRRPLFDHPALSTDKNAPLNCSRGPELLSHTFDDGRGLSLKVSNASMHVRAGLQVPPPAGGCALLSSSATAATTATHRSPAVMQQLGSERVEVPFTMSGDEIVVACAPGNESSPVLVNADSATCFLYGPTGLPAPPLALPCHA